MRISRGVALVAATTIVVGVLGGCDSAPGVLENAGSPPVVSNLDYSPDLVVFENVPDDDIIGDSIVVVDVAISAEAFDEDGDLDSVLFVVNDPFDPFEPLASGQLTEVGGSRYEGTAVLVIPRGNSGLYTLVVSAVDANQSVGNQVRGRIEYVLEGGDPPVIESVDGPSEITPPATFSFIATVSDPDGPGNIASVTTLAPDGVTYPLFDDGTNGGDVFPGDGRYTVSFSAPEGTNPGTFRFEFRAVDRQGNESEVVVKEVTVN